jgi:hypothetical protein
MKHLWWLAIPVLCALAVWVGLGASPNARAKCQQEAKNLAEYRWCDQKEIQPILDKASEDAAAKVAKPDSAESLARVCRNEDHALDRTALKAMGCK